MHVPGCILMLCFLPSLAFAFICMGVFNCTLFDKIELIDNNIHYEFMDHNNRPARVFIISRWLHRAASTKGTNLMQKQAFFSSFKIKFCVLCSICRMLQRKMKARLYEWRTTAMMGREGVCISLPVSTLIIRQCHQHLPWLAAIHFHHRHTRHQNLWITDSTVR